MSRPSRFSPLTRACARFARTLLPEVVVGAIRDAHLMSRSRRAFGINPRELAALRDAPRFRKTPFHLLNRQVELADAGGGWQCIHELLLEEIYRFRTAEPRPRILDCGANVGLSIIYFKQLYPDAEIVAFEPDPAIFQTLEKNVGVFGFSGVTLHRAAVWKEDGELSFVPDGGCGGYAEPGGGGGTSTVKAVRLRDFLDQPITLLKIDIEGAECTVIDDCRDHLANVERLFVEFHGRCRAPQQLDEMLGHLRRAGFRYHLKEAVRVDHPFLSEERDGEVYDLQLNIFASRD